MRKTPADAPARRMVSARLPITLVRRAHAEAVRRGTTFGSLMIDALEAQVPETVIIGDASDGGQNRRRTERRME